MIQKRSEKIRHAPVPSSWVTKPIFPPLPLDKPYSIEWKDSSTTPPHHYRWVSGCLPEYEGAPKISTPYQRGFDIRHFDVIVALLHQERCGLIDGKGNFYISFRGLLNLIDKDNSSKQKQYIIKLLDDLFNTLFLFEDLDSGDGVYGRVLDNITIRSDDKGKKHLVSLRLSQEFLRFLKELKKIVFIRFDIKVKMPSLIAQSLYTYIPSRAKFHSAADPWKISLLRLIQDLQLPIKKYRCKSLRYQLFTQHKPNRPSILEQLDGQYISNGGKLRVKLIPSTDGNDYFVCTWVEEWEKGERRAGKLFNWWLAAKGTEKEYWSRIKSRQPLDYEDKEYLESLGFDVSKDRMFFEMAKALVAYPEWKSILGEMKYRILHDAENKIQEPFAFFCTCIRKALSPDDPVLGIELTDDESQQEKEIEILNQLKEHEQIPVFIENDTNGAINGSGTETN